LVDAINGAGSIFLMIAVGFFIYKIGWITKEGDTLLVNLALKISVPCSLFSNAVSYLGEGLADSSTLSFILPPVSILLSVFLAYELVRLFKVDKRKRGLVISVFSMSNTIIIGLPVCTAIFGSSGIPYVIIYYAANTIIFWTIGANLIAADGGAKIELKPSILKRIFSPALISFFLGLGVVLLKLTVPAALMKAISSIGALNTPLCMIIVGTMAAKLGFREMFSLRKEGLIALSGRILLSPALLLAMALILGAGAYSSRVFLMMAAMPAMNQSVLVAKNSGADDALAAKLLSASALLMLVTVPLISWISGILLPV
jgi:predicted permease